jgi:heme/copper-type cytochrome/quinol oxidase subunit 2
MAERVGNARILVSATIGYIVSALFNSLLVIVKETREGVHDWLASTFGHHWIGHGILTILTFIIVTIITYSIYKNEKADERLLARLLWSIVGVTILSALIILGFFLAE